LLRAGVYRAWVSIIVLGVLLLVSAVVIADRLGRRVSTPVVRLAEVAEQLQQVNLDARVVPEGTEETVELAETLNRLAERIVELLAAERAAVVDLSHRLRTPVTALRLDAESVAEHDLAERLQGHIEQLQRTVDAILRDARRPLRSTLASVCDATAVVGERTAFWSALAEDQGRPVEVTLPEGPVLVGLDASDLTDVLDVLVDNVFAHTPDQAPFSVRLAGAGEGEVVLEVADQGPGLARVVANGSSEQRIGRSGLGLQIARRTVAAVGGHLQVETTDRGLRVSVRLPTVRTAAPPPRHPVG
jgi:signal transduction histidine kinase